MICQWKSIKLINQKKEQKIEHFDDEEDDKKKELDEDDEEETKQQHKKSEPVQKPDDDDDPFAYKEDPLPEKALSVEEEIELNNDDPAEKPLNSEDDADSEGLPDATDILTGFHEKVIRNGTKWKVNLKSCVLNTKGKEYILSSVAGEFEFM